MSDRAKSERTPKSERALPAELACPSRSALSRLPKSAKMPGRVARSSAAAFSGSGSAGGLAWNLLGKADSLLAESVGAGDASERFRCAYLAALRGAGAVLAVGATGSGRRKKSGNAWTRLDADAPTFGAWSSYFAGWSNTRAAVETGMQVDLSDADADGFSVEVGRFLTAVEDFVGQAHRIDLRAS
ncbi:SAV_6107 family HEPN domain-containing protein [Rhodococcus globerulus]|jgi:hypothetical protein|uniref:SAV_6107 family HEPN domain-containing protein n=1 Tax=Rhodococcus globerulus TaxID=33008 RepID=A0ABU4BT79_RHOGO|nr:SAV_6107 family HEPN domain-containing protein [Rhodococcus globerulus]MDV6267425.1 SAV_6107 family HEPN domain-containing protein [Rhodococcus globerulus]